MITVALVLALARSRRGQRCIRATTEALAPMVAIIVEAFLPIIVELANLAARIRARLPHRRDHHDHPAR